MNVYFDKKKDKRLISFIYNSNLFQGASINENLELIIDTTKKYLLRFIDSKINSTSLDEMVNTINVRLDNTITNTINRYQTIHNDFLQHVLNAILNKMFFNNIPQTQPKIAEYLVSGLESYFHKNTLRDDDFNWISIDNPRIVNFVWSSLRICNFDQTRNNVFINYEFHENTNTFSLNKLMLEKQERLYLKNNLEINPPSLKLKIESIKLFFDSLEVSLFAKEKLMSSIKNKWEEIKNRTEMIEWLNKNEELTTWAWSYIVENMLNKSIPEWVNISSSETKEIEQQTKNTIITLYDLLDRETDKKLLKSQLSKNGAQQKYRLKEKNNTRVLNLNVSIEAKNNLEKLKKIKNKSMKEIIEDLINEELDRMSSCR